MKYDTLLFDLDGTLLDTLDDLRDSTNHALRTFGLAERSREEIRSFVGNGVRNLMLKAVPKGTPDALFEAVFAEFRAHYAEHWRDSTQPYPQIMEMLEALKARGHRMAVISNKSDAEVKKLARDFFGELLPIAVGDRPGVPRKPEPDTVFRTLEALGGTPERALYIGDSEVDVRTARNAAVDLVAVSWGFRSREELVQAGAGCIIDSPLELLALV
ncbi:HAD family hydrolase [Mailhella sp.]|uniref:HAD family hydrolase n=1 Tax=Mailhella sp. TaxID=1981029 RepID=UPI004063C239